MTWLHERNWRKELILLGLIGMEAVWLVALYWILIRPGPGTSPLPTVVLVFVLLLLATSLSRMLAYRQAAPRSHWAIITAGLLLTIAAVLYLDLLPTGLEPGSIRLTLESSLSLLLVLATWWRGNTLAQLDITSPNIVIVHFWIGLSVFFLTIILGEAMLGGMLASPPGLPAVPVSAPTGRIVGFVPVYFFLSMITLTLARIEEVTQLPESTASNPRLRFWLGFIPGVAVLVVVASLLLSLFFTGGGLSWTLGLFPPLLGGIGQILDFFVRILLTLLGWFFMLLGLAVELLVNLMPMEQLKEATTKVLETIQQLGQLAREMEEEQASPDLWVSLGRYVPLVLFVLLVFLVGRAVRVRRQREKKLVPEQQSGLSGVWAEPGQGNRLREGLDRLADRFRDGLRFLRALSIRRIYANLSRLATQQGYPRPVHQTPYEYQALLDEAFPDYGAEVQLITQAYVAAHYGQVPDTHEGLERINQAWQRIRASK